MNTAPVTLTIAGSDCSTGAGIQADLKTFQHFQCFGLTAVTCVVAETPEEVRSIHPVPPEITADQIEILLESYPIGAIKTGMLYSAGHVLQTAGILQRYPEIPLVVDPVMIASSGAPLIEDDAMAAYRQEFFPRATLITPNLDEAEHLYGSSIRSSDELEIAARSLSGTFGCSILLKGGHLEGNQCTDLLCYEGEMVPFTSPRLDTPASHGTGCTLSAAITAQLALGRPLPEAVQNAKAYLNSTLSEALKLGEMAALNQGTVPPAS